MEQKAATTQKENNTPENVLYRIILTTPMTTIIAKQENYFYDNVATYLKHAPR